MKFLKYGISSLTVIVFLFSSCQKKTPVVVPEYLSNKEIPDWNEIYPLLLPSALEWDPDAKLNTAFIQINWQNDPEQRLVSAFFQSPNKDFETLHLEYLNNETVTASVNAHGVPIPNFDLIERTEWKLNSSDAWNLFLENSNVVSADPKFFECSSLVLLKKAIGSEEKKLVWQLSLADCERTVLIQYFIDAGSGDFLGAETH